VGLVVGFILLEIVVRLFIPEPILPRFVIDSGYGVLANQPNVVTRHYVPGDYEVLVSTNSVDMRGTREYSVAKPHDVHRVAVIGDSFVFGFGVNDDEVISAILENKLNEGANVKSSSYEVINFSVSGSGQAEQLVTYRERLLEYNPNDVVLFYYSNDIGNNRVSRLFFVAENGELKRTVNSYLPGIRIREMLYGTVPTRLLFTHSQGWNFIRNRLSRIVQGNLLKREGLKSFSETKPEAVELTQKLLLQFITEATENGSRVIVVIIPKRIQKTNFPLHEQELAGNHALLIDGRKYLTTEDYYVRDSH